jgi:universal stress protein E
MCIRQTGKAVARKVWLVAKDTRHHNLLQRTLLTNTDWQLIRDCPVPLWLVKPHKLAAEPVVLAALDPLHEYDKPAALDDRIFEFAGDLARVGGGSMHVFHAFSMPMGVELPPNVRELIVREHQTAMEKFLSSHAIARANVHVYEGAAHECLQKAAIEHAADFVVMGAVSRRGLSRLFIGSTAERALDRLACDLIILKPAGFQGPAHVGD